MDISHSYWKITYTRSTHGLCIIQSTEAESDAFCVRESDSSLTYFDVIKEPATVEDYKLFTRKWGTPSYYNDSGQLVPECRR